MKLYWSPKTRSSRVVWMLEETGVDYEIEPVDIRAEHRRDSAAFRSASPMGKVPALQDGETLMAESAAICLYLADRYASPRLAPALDSAQRGRFLYWLMYTPAVVEPAMAEKFSGSETNRVSHGWGDFDSMLATLRNGVQSGDWVLGETFSAADVMLGSSVLFLRLFGLLPDDAVLNAYADRCADRKAYKKAQALEADH